MKFIKEHQKIFDLLAEGISEGIVLVNADRIIVGTNTSADEMFGYERGELVEKPLNTLIPDSYRSGHDTHVNKFIEKGKKRRMAKGSDLYGIRKNNEVFPLEVGLNPFKIEGNHYVMALVIDVTERKKNEQQIKELNADLEVRIEQRTKELKNTVEVLEDEVIRRKEAEDKAKESLKKEKELGELKTKFLSLVSHEFKTPLSTILTSTTLTGKYTKEEQQEKREKHLSTIKNKVKYLDNILNDFLSIERLESGKVNYKHTTFPLSKIVNQVVYDANMLLKSGQKILYPENIDDLYVESDEKILELILSNLIHNAVKYSPENTTIDFKVIPDEDFLTIQVVDQGIGIPEAEQKFIFNRYFRAENALLNQGTGIGLNIVKGHLENIGGSISFTSIENKGSTFTIKIPVKQP